MGIIIENYVGHIYHSVCLSDIRENFVGLKESYFKIRFDMVPIFKSIPKQTDSILEHSFIRIKSFPSDTFMLMIMLMIVSVHTKHKNKRTSIPTYDVVYS
jgi:hypothetical protein